MIINLFYKRGLFVILVLNLILMTLNTILCSVLICFFALIKLLLPSSVLRTKVSDICDFFLWTWASVNHWLLKKTTKVDIHVEGFTDFDKKGWYLLIANHQSWADIVIIYCVFRNRIPMAKFFLKQELLYVPFLGMACWALNMPFMKRYSTKYLLRHPEKRGEDLASTRKACQIFKDTPTTVVNFVEGTRFTEKKRLQTSAGFEYLLKPKTGGIAYTLDVMGEQFDKIIDVTLVYPSDVDNYFVNLLSGKIKKIHVQIEAVDIDENLLGDYFNDASYKQKFQHWLNQRWLLKDRFLKDFLAK